jgi:hypothetical protein
MTRLGLTRAPCPIVGSFGCCDLIEHKRVLAGLAAMWNNCRFPRPLKKQRPAAKPGVAETASLVTNGANDATDATDANPSGGASPTDASPRGGTSPTDASPRGGASPSRTYTTPSHANHIANRPLSRWD